MKIKTGPENAEKFRLWLDTRGGILKWTSADLSDPGWSVFTPATDVEGFSNFDKKPHWKAAANPDQIKYENEVEIVTPKEIRRFRVAIRRGSQGLSFKLTDAASKKLRNAMDKIENEDKWYEFDYDTQEAVIYVPGEKLPLKEWEAKYNVPANV